MQNSSFAIPLLKERLVLSQKNRTGPKNSARGIDTNSIEYKGTSTDREIVVMRFNNESSNPEYECAEEDIVDEDDETYG